MSTSETTPQKQNQDSLKQQPQVPPFSGIPDFPNGGGFQMLPVMYPAVYPGCIPLQNQEQMNNGAGIYAVPVLPYMGQVPGIQANTLIPLTYSTPTTRQSTNSGTGNDEHGQAGQQQQHQPAPQRQVVVRRFQVAFQLDLLLILKLAAMIFLFNQDGSRQRLFVLVFFASLIYLYQTGALAPLVRWLSQGMQRAAAPRNPPRPTPRAENAPGVAGPGNENAAIAEGLAGAENENRPADDVHRAAENENLIEPGAQNANNRWWGIVKEIQIIVFGFITSLLPGFHNID